MGEKFGNDLDGLMYMKKNLDHNIEFQFNHIDKEEEEILRKHNII